MPDDPLERDRCEMCGRVARLVVCECCGLCYCSACGMAPDEGGYDCPNVDCNLYPVPRG
jgi:hypothetical protein